MKQLLLFTTLIFTTTVVFTQDYNRQWVRNNLNLRLGPEFGLAIGDFNKTQAIGLGASALLDIPVAPRFSLIGYVGYVSFAGDKISSTNGTKHTRSNVFPIRAGINYKLTESFYAGGQLGQVSMLYLGDRNSGVSQSIGVGYFNGYFDTNLRWDHQYVHGGLSSLNLKFAYVLQLGVRR